MPEQRSEDLTLPPNEFALVLDKTSGIVYTYCGPINASLSAQESPVVFNYGTKRFGPVDLANAKQLKQLAPEGWYIILKNPADDKDPAKVGEQPEEGKKARMPTLRVGHKINIPGPATFALWPGQMAQVVQGHHLRQDEYLIARVYDGVAARRSFRIAEGAEVPESSLIPKDFTPGHLFIIKGTETSFYMPLTGIEVVREPASPKNKPIYVRSAVSLERLEYCLLRDQDGNRRYVQGPAVVFPEPTEEFKTNTLADGTTTRKFRAIELGPKNGIHVKVTCDYKEQGTDVIVKAGTELFITGTDTPIYFPREEHAIIKYGDSDVNFGVAIPPGEARYVMQRLTGEIALEKGPQVFLPDPRTRLIVRRVLDQRLCALMYPGNSEALQVNQRRAAAAAARADEDMPLAVAGAAGALSADAFYASNMTRSVTIGESAAPAGFHGDAMNRQGQYRPPRTITLDSKYEGAVTMDIHEGYAVMLVTKRGNRRVVLGPQTALLEYDEVPHVLTLSTGKPKNMDKPFKTVYLMVSNNYVTDIIEAETKDYCKITTKLSYRLNFEGDRPEKWFAVENYVKLLCDNMRSTIRNCVQRLGIKEFYHNATDILRDLILGAAVADKGRPGKFFPENGLRVFDVEVLSVSLDKDLQTLLEKQERATIQQTLELEDLQRRSRFAEQSLEFEAAILKNQEAVRAQKEAAARAKAKDEAETKALSQKYALDAQTTANEINDVVRDNKKRETLLQVEGQRMLDALKVALLEAETSATKDRMLAITPDLVSALQSFGDQASLERLAQAMSAQAFLRTVGGESIVDVLAKILQGSNLAERLPAAVNGKTSVAKQLST